MSWSFLFFISLLGILLAIVIYYRHSIGRFLSEVKVELEKVSWPWDPQESGFRRYKELIDSTVVVVVSTIMLAGFVTFSDWILRTVIGAVTKFGV